MLIPKNLSFHVYAISELLKTTCILTKGLILLEWNNFAIVFLLFIKRLLFWNHISNCLITLFHFGCRTSMSLSITSMLVSSGSKTIFTTCILSGRSFLCHKNRPGSNINPCSTPFLFPSMKLCIYFYWCFCYPFPLLHKLCPTRKIGFKP